MISFDLFTEALSNPYPADLIRINNQKYRAISKLDDGGELKVDIEGDEHIDDYDHMDWQINFHRNGVQSVTGDGDAFRIFATVMKLIRDFVKKEQPKYMSVSAAKDKKSKGKNVLQGRERLYKRLLQKDVGSKYSIDTQTSSSGTMFAMKRKR